MKLAYTLDETAEALTISKRTLHRLIADNQGPKTTKLGTRTVILPQHLQEWQQRLASK